ncbi:MAG TPA: rhamnulokinase family protein [Terriglobia bacterium]|nr:rhamnulokinase family protein [Terriglobia bacterium]
MPSRTQPVPAYVAVDLGAGSGRVIVARLESEQLSMEEVRRFRYEPNLRNGRLRWPAAEILGSVESGLQQAGEFARRNGAVVASIGVDSWGVDYGLIDAAGSLCEDPVCYRDRRTAGVMERIFERVSREELYARTGIQLMAFNTLFQLAAHAATGLPEGAERLLLIPDLVHFFLSGRAATEYTNATTTQMLNAGSGNWDTELLGRLGLPARLLGEIVPAGENLGPLKSELRARLQLDDASLVAPATHDTASAVVGAPLEAGYAYISSGTWSLAGVEHGSPLINPDTARNNFTNEGGAFGVTRFLKNVMGLWIFESCRREWSTHGTDVPYDETFRKLNTDQASTGLIYPDDPRFFSPRSMLASIADQLRETRQNASEAPADVTKVILDSLAFRYASVIRTIEFLTGTAIRGIHIVGGGSRNDYLNQVTASASGLPVVAGPVEATAIGNVLIQGIRAGRFQTLAEARRYVSQHVALKRFAPHPSRSWAEAARRYADIEARYQEHPPEH